MGRKFFGQDVRPDIRPDVRAPPPPPQKSKEVHGNCKVLILLRVWSFDPHALYIFVRRRSWAISTESQREVVQIVGGQNAQSMRIKRSDPQKDSNFTFCWRKGGSGGVCRILWGVCSQTRFAGHMVKKHMVRSATLQKCGSDIFLRFLAKSVVKFGVKYWWIFRATFSRVWVCEGKFHQNFLSKFSTQRALSY